MIKRISYATFLCCLWMGGVSVFTIGWSAAVTLTVTYVFLPLLYKTCPAIPRHLIFLNYVYFPFHYNFKKPATFGLEGTDNFYYTVKPGVVIGVWHLLPRPFNTSNPPPSLQETDRPALNRNQEGSCSHSDYYENELRDGRPVVLYLHGNTSCRAQPSRVALYKVLTNMGYHVITIDYRGYGDSSAKVPSEEGVVEDAYSIYYYIRRIVRGNAKVIVWGHSLGTGVACHAVHKMCDRKTGPDALVLESPFNTIRDEVAEHPLAAVFSKMPCFSWFFLDPLEKSNLKFDSQSHIVAIDSPVLILHAEDDLVVPCILGRRLYDYGTKHRPDHFPTIRFILFKAHHHFGHKFIHLSPKLPEIVSQFLEDVSVI